MSAPTPACTVILMRREGPRFRVLMLERHRKSGFMPAMWVFPGGRIEPGDDLAATSSVCGVPRAVPGLTRRRVAQAVVAGIRETFEESGVWLGDGVLPQSLRLPLQRGEVTLADALMRHGAVIALDRMVPWARWVTPEGEGRRFDALFLVAEVLDAEAHHDEEETVNSGWFEPDELLRAGPARLPLAPPTFCVIRELAELGSIEAVLAASTTRDLRPVQPVRGQVDGRLVLYLPGGRNHPEPRRDGLPTRIEARVGDGGWRAVDG